MDKRISILLLSINRPFLFQYDGLSIDMKVPAGIFIPSMTIGALFGRTIGMIIQILQEYVLEKFLTYSSMSMTMSTMISDTLNKGKIRSPFSGLLPILWLFTDLCLFVSLLS